MIGVILGGRFGIVRKLGMGGMGAVFEAEDVTTGQRVAVKVISTGDALKDKALIGRFQREARAASSIDTEHIVRVLETGTDAETGQPFMAMELLDGEDLQQLFRRLGQLPPELALRLVAQACMGLGRAHAARVIHRDVKPANLFLARRAGDTRSLKILDFGIAKIRLDQTLSTETTGLTRSGGMLGSPVYMSPEQARGAKTIDHRADLWSLGVVLYQALTARTPHGEIDALGELILAICSELPPPVQELAPWVSPEIATIVHKALRLDPAERYQSAEEMLSAIQAVTGLEATIPETMLVSVAASERARVAVRIAMEPLGPSHELRPRSAPPPSGPVSTEDGLTFGTSGVRHPSDRVPGAAPSARPSRAPRSMRGLLALGGSVVVASLGAALFFGLGRGSHSAGAPEVALPVEGAASPPASDTVLAAPAPSARRVKVVILPRGASVDVDGTRASTTDGVLEVSGLLGSVHKVRVSQGSAQSTIDVVVTESGAMPPKIELDAPSKKVTTAAAPRAVPGVTTAAPAAKSPAAQATAAAPATGLKESFE